LVSCPRCHKKFKSYEALNGHWHDAHSNVKWPDGFETKLTEEKGLESFKVSRNVGKISYRKWILITLVIVIILVGITASALRLGNQPVSTNTTSSTSGPSSSTTSPLSINDFNISPVPFTICLNGSNGFKIESLQASIQNNLNLPFHYISATIIFANYTLANGTVVTVNHQWIDKNQTFNTTHTFNLGADFKIPNGGMKIVNVEFVITAYVQEVSQPITKLVIWSSKC